jgi:hypothetical protein
MADLSPEEGFDAILKHVLEPFLQGKALNLPGIDLAGHALQTLDRVADFSLSGASLLRSPALAGYAPVLEKMVKAEDRVTKKGRILQFHIASARRLKIGPAALSAAIEGPFSLAFSTAGQGFADSAVAERLRKAVSSLPGLSPAPPAREILVAAVLPQHKKMLGVHTPLAIEVMGMRFSLRFFLAFFHQSRLRLFAAGPTVREIPI